MNNIKKLREAAGMTQRELSARLHVAQASVARWELGLTNPSWEKAPELAWVLGCSIDALFSGGPGAPAPCGAAPATYDTRDGG